MNGLLFEIRRHTVIASFDSGRLLKFVSILVTLVEQRLLFLDLIDGGELSVRVVGRLLGVIPQAFRGQRSCHLDRL